jgi:hypothetical protein
MDVSDLLSCLSTLYFDLRARFIEDADRDCRTAGCYSHQTIAWQPGSRGQNLSEIVFIEPECAGLLVHTVSRTLAGLFIDHDGVQHDWLRTAGSDAL